MKVIKIAPCLIAFLMLSGMTHAQDSNVSFHDLMSRTQFSTDRLPIDVSKAHVNHGFPSEPTFSKGKLTRPSVLVGLGMVATGAVLAATAGESATVSTFNPISQQPITSTISVTNNGRRWVGIGLLGSGGVLTLLGLSK